MYTETNFKTKKALKAAVENGEKVRCYQPNDIFNTGIPKGKEVSVEGPHYPRPHSWYARVLLDAEGYVVKVK
jgi:hypothetical protein